MMTDPLHSLTATTGESPPQVVSSQTVFAGKIIDVRVDEITVPGGGTASREVVRHPGAIVVAALDRETHIFLVRQYRHPIGHELLELPAGTLEPGEKPLEAAKRELREEVGLEASLWTSLPSFFSSPGFANERLHPFLAQKLKEVPPDPDDDEVISVVRYPLAGLMQRLDEIADGKTLATLLLLQRVLPT
jgi:8-oxo-dGTP pyrophosphatase MutT (NUDIX family)